MVVWVCFQSESAPFFLWYLKIKKYENYDCIVIFRIDTNVPWVLVDFLTAVRNGVRAPSDARETPQAQEACLISNFKIFLAELFDISVLNHLKISNFKLFYFVKTIMVIWDFKFFFYFYRLFRVLSVSWVTICAAVFVASLVIIRSNIRQNSMTDSSPAPTIN